MLGGSGQKNQMSQDGQTKALTIIIIFFKKKGLNKKTETKPQVEANIHNSKTGQKPSSTLGCKVKCCGNKRQKRSILSAKTLCSNGALQIPTEIGNGESPQDLLQDSF